MDDVERVRVGETLRSVKPAPTATREVTPVEDVATKKAATTSPKKPPQASKNNVNMKASGDVITEKRLPSQKSYASVVPKKSNVNGGKQRQNQKPTGTSDPKPNHPPLKAVEQQQQVIPLQGTAKVVCGCFGTQHKALNNCLRCGRISCEREGYDYCPFCRYMVPEHRSSSMMAVGATSHVTTNDMEAWEQKERLLQYDREFAQRTIILDDQADYYNRATSNWLNESEQRQAQEQEQERTATLQTRPKPKMILDL